jgi:protein-disulfide isomerase
VSMLFKTAAFILVALGGAIAAQAPAASMQVQPLTAEQRGQFEQWWNAQPLVSLPFENNGAKVLLVEFTDLQCPHCRQKYLEIKPILEKYAARPKEMTFLLKHWPVSSACNPRVTTLVHPAACDAAAAVVMARRKGTADKLVDWFFTHQDEMTPATVRRDAAAIGNITDFDAQYARALQEVKTDAALGTSIGVDGTPAFFVNGRRVPGGGLTPQYFGALIELELARAK